MCLVMVVMDSWDKGTPKHGNISSVNTNSLYPQAFDDGGWTFTLETSES